MSQLNLDEAREWISIVYGDTPGLIHVCSTMDWKGLAFSHEDPARVEKVLAYIQGCNARGAEGIYLRACTLRSIPETGRGGDELSFYLPGLWADIDIAGPGHKSKGTLPPTVEEGLKVVEASGLPQPTHWIHSGGGLYPWWLLQNPAEITNLEDFRSLSGGWQQALLRGSAKLGYTYGSGVGDLSRVLRIPGTVNRKQGLERACTMLAGHDWNGPLYDLDRLVEALSAVTPAPAPPTPLEIKMGSSRQGDRPGDEFNRTADWRDILIPHGWQWLRQQGDTWYLRRPGKMSGGHSATLRSSTDRLWVFSEEAAPFEPFKLYDKFSAYAALEHHGDFQAAARELGARGYGQRSSVGVAMVQSPVVDATSLVSVRMPSPPHGDSEMEQATAPAAPLTRPQLIMNDDRLDVLNNLTTALRSRWDQSRLFNFGDIICERDGNSMRPLSKGSLDAITHETCLVRKRTYDSRRKEEERERLTPSLVEARVLDMVLSRPREFSRLDKLSQIPIVRPDGTICTKPGYDASTYTFLELDPSLHGIEVPDNPTREQVQWSKALLLDELLGDFPLHTEADRANALATLITPFIRDMIPTSPLAVIDAKEAGSGKNLMADIISILTTGKSAQTLPYTVDDNEQRKVITSAFRSGVSILLFDEAHEIEGASFARALTSHSYQDRVLGSSALAEFPNNRTWISLGNQVQIKGDMARRVYRVRLEYNGAGPESREASQFRHPDLRQWALDNRRDLVTACLIMVRAWHSLGRPQAKLPFRMGSFERWQETLAGILWVAGVEDFLANVPQWRSESDFERQHSVNHLEWLGQQYGTSPFTATQVTEALKRDRTGEHPPGMDDPFPEGYARRLGQWYARMRDRVLEGMKLVKLESQGHNNTGKWAIVRAREDEEQAP